MQANGQTTSMHSGNRYWLTFMGMVQFLDGVPAHVFQLPVHE